LPGVAGDAALGPEPDPQEQPPAPVVQDRRAIIADRIVTEDHSFHALGVEAAVSPAGIVRLVNGKRAPIGRIPGASRASGGHMNSGLNIIELDRYVTHPGTCSYLPDETSMFSYRVILDLSPEAYLDLLSRGWRRFGWQFFRPSCQACSKCRSLRIPVDRFRPSRSQRRTLRRNEGIRMIERTPTITAEHLRLYNAYHADMHGRRGWPIQTISAELYESSFVRGGGGGAREFLYLEGDTLIGVALVDVLPQALSSVYFFHDPRYRARGLGVFSILRQLEFARNRGIPHQYLGYWIAECQSMSYKSQFRPHELLERYPSEDESPLWREPREPDSELPSRVDRSNVG
jgi:arginine-tRNA-protein transferase